MKKLAVAFLLACTGSAWAQYGELWFSAGQSLITNGKLGTFSVVGGSEDDVELTDGFRFGFRFATNQDGHGGYEIQYAYSRMQLRLNDPAGVEPSVDYGMAAHTGGVNYLLYATPLDVRIRPFATGGVHFTNFVPPGASATSGGGSTKFGFNYGGGIKIRVLEIAALRFDFRQYTNPKPNFGTELRSGWFRQNEVSAGIGLVF